MAAVCDYIDDVNQGSGATCGRTPEQYVEIVYTEPEYVENAATGKLEEVGNTTAYNYFYLCPGHVKGDTGLFSVQNPGDAWTLSDYLEFLNPEYGDEILEVTVRSTVNTDDDSTLFL